MLSNVKTFNIKDRNAIFYPMKKCQQHLNRYAKKYAMSVSWQSLISYLALTCTMKILSRAWKEQAVAVVKNALLWEKVQSDLKTGIHFLPMTPTNSSL